MVQSITLSIYLAHVIPEYDLSSRHRPQCFVCWMYGIYAIKRARSPSILP